MSNGEKPPLPWETRIAIGSLALLSFQHAHEIFLFCTGSDTLGSAGFGAGSVIFLTLTLGILIGLAIRSPLAWGLGVLVLGGLGALCLAVSWHVLHEHFPGGRDVAMRRIADNIEYEWLKPLSLKTHQAIWLASKIVLMLTVPLVLLMGRLREKLRATQINGSSVG